MSSSPNDTNMLIGRFMDLQEGWEDNPEQTDWAAVDALAKDGAHAYNDGAGLSFHLLMLEGICHTPFHERFIKTSIDEGFDPFTLTMSGQGALANPVINHENLAEAAQENSSSAAMQETIRQFARKRFDATGWASLSAEQRQRVLATCADSIPEDLLAELKRSS
jgi:hypothetical protein